MKLHRNVLHKLLCSTECDKCVCTSVKGTDVGLCVVVFVFVEKLEISQHLYTQGRFRVYQHLTDLNSERPQTEDVNALRYNREMFVYDIRTQICQ